MHLAQINIARALTETDDPAMADFMVNLDPINDLADRSPGFVWRLQTDDGNATSVRAFDDPMLLLNMSVWESVETLREYVYKTAHTPFLRRRKEWFEAVDELPVLALWWIPEGHIPTPAEAIERLEALRDNGPTPHAFTFAKTFPPPG